MLAQDSYKYQFGKLDQDDRYYFIVDILEGLKSKTALIWDISSADRSLHSVPLENINILLPPSEGKDNSFQKIIVNELFKSGVFKSSIFHCDTIFKPYQFRPLLKFEKNNQNRLLIADETGLGKTIEAGYILINEMSKRPINKVVILCPSGLRYKWKGEIWKRFGIRFEIIRGSRLINALGSKRSFYYIVSFDGLSSEKIRELENTSYENKIDFLIIDEIHNMIGRGGDTIRRRFGLYMSMLSQGVVGLTATPVHLEMMDLKRILDIVFPGLKSNITFEREMIINEKINQIYQLLSRSILDQDNHIKHHKIILDLKKELEIFDPSNKVFFLNFLNSLNKSELNDAFIRDEFRKKIIKFNTLNDIMTRSRKIEVGEDRKRIVKNHNIVLNGDIQKAYQNGMMVEISEKSLFNELNDFMGKSFYHVHKRQLSSCFPAMADLMRIGMQGFNVWIDGDKRDVEITFDEESKSKSEELANKYNLITHDTKWDDLKETLKEMKNNPEISKVIIFTEWIPTINYLRERARVLGIKAYIISGEDNDYQRAKITNEFQKHEGFTVLFASDVMSEGIDLQSANCIINYDLPYNPQKIEQRIGRVDRIGQESDKIYIHNYLVEGSTDQIVYEKLYSRIGIFEKTVGGIPNLLNEEKFEEGVIDEDKIIRVISENKIREDILESGSLSILDHIADDGIRQSRKQNLGHPISMRWIALQRCIDLLLGNKLERNILENEVLILSHIDMNDIKLLTSLVDIKDRNDLKYDLLQNIDQKGQLALTCNKDTVGLFLPYHHPLMMKAIEVSFNSFFTTKYRNSAENLFFDLEFLENNQFNDLLFLAFIENVFDGLSFKDKKYVWLGYDDEGNMRELPENTLHILFRMCEAGKCDIDQSDLKMISPLLRNYLDDAHLEEAKFIEQDILYERNKIKIKIDLLNIKLNNLNENNDNNNDNHGINGKIEEIIEEINLLLIREVKLDEGEIIYVKRPYIKRLGALFNVK